MWPWRQNAQLKYQLFWARLLAVVLTIHALVLYGFLFIQHGVNLADHLTITAQFANGELPVVFMPLYKHVPGTLQKLNTQIADNAKIAGQVNKSRAAVGPKTSAKPVVYKLKPKIKPVKAKISSKLAPSKISPAKIKSLFQAGKLKSPKLALKSKSTKPPVSTGSKSKVIPETAAPAPPVTPVPKVTPETTAPANTELTSKPAAPVPAPANLPAPVSATDNTNSSNPDSSNSNTSKLAAIVTANHNLANNANNSGETELVIGRKDLELLQLQDGLRMAVAQSWRPPLGFKRELTTIVELLVDQAGVLEQVNIKQSSGVLVFDASVELALNQVSWPPEAWGKTHTLTFKQ